MQTDPSRTPGASASDPERAPRGAIQRAAYLALKEGIILRDFPPGALLSEATLSASLGFGRSPIRWALQRLAMEGLVEILPQRGVMVTEISAEVQLRVLEVRAELERLMVTRAASRASPPQRVEMERLADAILDRAGADDGLGFMDALRQLHDLTAEAADNPVLSNCMAQIQGLSRRFWYAYDPGHADLMEGAAHHAARLRAVAAGDTDAAARASDRLVAFLEAFTLRSVASAQAKGGS